MVDLPAHFSLARFQFSLEPLEALHLPPHKGNVLRGGFGITLKRLVCVQPHACRQQCRLGNRCPYGYLFETSPPEGAEALRNFSEVPRPFVIEPPAEQRMLFTPGEELPFALTLIGRGIDYLPYFIAVFRELGQAGLGRRRGRFRLKTIEAVWPYTDQTETVYRAEDELVRTPHLILDSRAITARAATLPPGRLTLNFLTPTRLKHQGRWVETGPSFQVLVKGLLGRISSLSYFHCGQPLEADFRGLIDRAAGVKIAESQTRWEDWARFSGRQQQRIELGGLVGRVTYQGALGEYLPLLALGEWLHVGKGTVFGNGQVQIVQEQTS
jgi:hypothetical protein